MLHAGNHSSLQASVCVVLLVLEVEIVTLAHKLLNLNRDRPLRSTVGHPATGRPLFWAYGHYDQPCRRCGTRLKRGEIDDAAPSITEPCDPSAVQHLRQIAWCPRCQGEDS